MKDNTMQKMQIILLTALLILTSTYAKDTTLQLTYETLDFDHSKKKDTGKRIGVSLEYQQENDLYQIAYEKTNTDTFKPPLEQDLHVNKYYFKYTRKLEGREAFSLSYARIDDNLMKETDGGDIYGFGYKYAAFCFTQYLSDYKHFNVYQTDLKYIWKQTFGEFKTTTAFIGKYIHLEDRESNAFSMNAKEDYFTPGVKIHLHYHDYHMGAGAFFGKRIFAVMYDGFKVQHHAMEFEKTYMVGFGKHFADMDLNLKYVYQKATEIPIYNDNVIVQNVILQFVTHF